MDTAILTFLAGYSDPYVQQILLPGLAKVAKEPAITRDDALRLLADPALAVRFALSNFAFAHAGGERAGYGDIAVEAVDETERSDGDDAWPSFERICRTRGIGPNPKANQRPLQGLYSTYRLGCFGDQGLFAGIAEKVKRTHSIFDHYVDLMTLAGLGPKITAFLLRDLVFIWDIEEEVKSADQLFLQPVDVWVRRAASSARGDRHRDDRIPGLLDDRIPGLAVAQLLAATCLEAGVSGVKFNQGAWFFGSQKVSDGSYAERVREAMGAKPVL